MSDQILTFTTIAGAQVLPPGLGNIINPPLHQGIQQIMAAEQIRRQLGMPLQQGLTVQQIQELENQLGPRPVIPQLQPMPTLQDLLQQGVLGPQLVLHSEHNICNVLGLPNRMSDGIDLQPPPMPNNQQLPVGNQPPPPPIQGNQQPPVGNQPPPPPIPGNQQPPVGNQPPTG